MEKKKTPNIKTGEGIAGILVLLAILIAANVIVGNMSIRADLTEEKLYTLSGGTRRILSELEDPVTLKLFFNGSSPEAPVFLKNYASKVEDLLREYHIASDGNVIVEKYDPKPDSDAEEWAQSYGVTGQPMDMFGPPIYFGLVAVFGDNEAVIPAIDPRAEELLEYNVTRMIYRVVNPEKPVVAVLSSLPVMGFNMPYPTPGANRQNMPPWFAFADLRNDYDIRELSPNVEKIGSDVDTLILVHPKSLSDKTIYAIDQYILKGGRLLAFMDPLCLTDQMMSPQQQQFSAPTPSELPKLLAAWGLKWDGAEVLVDMKSAARLQMSAGQIEDNPVWLNLQSENLNEDDIITTKLESLMLPCAGVFEGTPIEGLDLTPLAVSSDEPAKVDAMTAQFGMQAVLRSKTDEPPGPQNVAVRLSGTFKTAFPDGPPKSGEEESEAQSDDASRSHVVEGTSSVILVGDVDMLFDRFAVRRANFLGFEAHQPLNDNINLLANAVEQMAGSEALIGIRSRGTFARPFDKVIELEQKARTEWRAREDMLEQKLQETQSRLRELQARKDADQQFILSNEQQAAIKGFREEVVTIKKELKEVRKNLRRDIERLGTRVKAINIALMPLLVSLAGVAFAIYRHKKA